MEIEWDEEKEVERTGQPVLHQKDLRKRPEQLSGRDLPAAGLIGKTWLMRFSCSQMTGDQRTRPEDAY